jgi:predicted P-loop ATPase
MDNNEKGLLDSSPKDYLSKTIVAPSSKSELALDETELRRFLAHIFTRQETVEVRGLFNESTYFAFFRRSDDLDVVVRRVQERFATAGNSFYSLNVPNPKLYDRAPCRFVKALRKPSDPEENGPYVTADQDITRLHRILVDVDPLRKADDQKISATFDEKRAAFDVAWEVVKYFFTEIGPEYLAITVDSGNGCHLVYTIDLPNDADSVDLINRILTGLSRKFSNATAHIDTAVGNPSRISGLPGTVKRKGQHSAERPHRVVQVTNMPQSVHLAPVPMEALVKLADKLAADGPKASGTRPTNYSGRKYKPVTKRPQGAEYTGPECLRDMPPCMQTLYTIQAQDITGSWNNLTHSMGQACRKLDGLDAFADRMRLVNRLAFPDESRYPDRELNPIIGSVREQEYNYGCSKVPGMGKHCDVRVCRTRLGGIGEEPQAVEAIVAQAVERLKGDPAARQAATSWLFTALREERHSESAASVILRDWIDTVNRLAPGARRYTLKEAEAALDAAYEASVTGDTGAEANAQYITSKTGEIRALLANALTALRTSPEWSGVLGYNTFKDEITVLKQAPIKGIEAGTKWADAHDTLVNEWLQQHGIYVSTAITYQAVQAVAMENSFHPVKDYLHSLVWDGTKRVDTWLSDFMGAEDNDYTRSIGAMWLISAVARIYRPGCQVDHTIVLEGPQGKGKSTTLKALAGEENFTDNVSDFGTKDLSQEMRGVWIIEFAELANMAKSSITANQVKAFLTRTHDRYRPAYGRRVIDQPRQCVFAGSVNDQTYLRDETGNRRFWPVHVPGPFKRDEIQSLRDHLWAESVARYRAGESWWIKDNPDMLKLVEDEQEQRFENDPWEGTVMEYAGLWMDRGVTITEILTIALEKPRSMITKADSNRVGAILRHNKWTSKKSHGVQTFSPPPQEGQQGEPRPVPRAQQGNVRSIDAKPRQEARKTG